MIRPAIRSLLFGALLSLPASLAQAQSHVYNLNNSYTDVYGGPSLTPNGGTLSASGYAFGANQGLSLSGVFSAGSSYSIAIRSAFADTIGWRKIVDYKNLTMDEGYYAYYSEANSWPWIYGPDQAYTPNNLAFTVITRDASTNVFAMYVNGVQQGSFIDALGDADFTEPNGLAHFFIDDFITSQLEATDGVVNYIAIYDVALDPNQVANLPEPTSVTLVATGLLGVFGVARRKRNASRATIA